MKNSAKAQWKGTGLEGKGILSTKSKVLDASPYTVKTRFEGAAGTNPEELIAAAHAGCFAMKLSFNLSEAGFTPEQLDVDCEIHMKDFKITLSHLTLKAQVSGIEQAKFEELVKDAELNCPISVLLNTEIKVDHSLNT